MTRSTTRLWAGAALAALLAAPAPAQEAEGDMRDGPGGEAGVLSLRDLGYMVLGTTVSEPDADGNVTVSDQMFVEYALPAEPAHAVPVILVHGGGGQAADWFGTPDGRDGWRDHIVAAGFDTYAVDRPGYGRSPAAPTYGEGQLGQANSGIIARLAQSENWPGGEVTPTNDAVVGWLATSPTTPYGGNALAARDLSLLLDEIGPAILVAHSAGGPSTLMAADMNPGQVKGIVLIEAGGSNPISSEELRKGLGWEPALAEGYAPGGTEACPTQGEGGTSTLPNLAGIPVVLIASGIFHTAETLDCNLAGMTAAGVDATAHLMPDEGFAGVGHFMMAETNSADTAAFLVGQLEALAGD